MDPALDDFLRSRQWERAFSAENIDWGLDLISNGKVSDQITISDAGVKLTLGGTVATTGARGGGSVTAEIVLEKDPCAGRVTLRSSCTCGARNFCSHRYGVLFVATEQMELSSLAATAGLRMDVARWLEKVQLAATGKMADEPVPKAAAGPCIGYALWHHHARGWLVVPRNARREKDGAFTLRDGQPSSLWGERERGEDDDDLRIRKMLDNSAELVRQCGPYGHLGYLPRGKGSGAMLKTMLATGRLCEADRDGDFVRMIAEGAPCRLTPGWKEDNRGRMVPHLETERPNWDILLADEPWCFDPESGTLHPVESSHPPGFLALWAAGPPVMPDEVASAAGVIDTMPVAVPRPLTTPVEHRKPKEIQPVLKLRRVSSADGLILDDPALSLVLGLPVFRYGDGAEFDPLEQGEDPVGKIRSKEKLVLIHRPVAMEDAAIAALRDAGLEFLREELGGMALGPRLYHAAFPILSYLDDPLAWFEWMNTPEHARLLEKGWLIEQAEDAAVEMLTAGDDFLALEPGQGDGIDWFSFDWGVEAGGRRVSLLPAFAQAFEAHGEALLKNEPPEGEFMAIPIDEGGRTYLRFPARRFFEMARHVFELFGGMPGGAVKLHRIEAAELASRGAARELLVETETLLALRRLGDGLHDFQGAVPAGPPAGLQAILRPYQLEGFRWLQFLARHGLHGILADDMGLGKTVQTLAHIVAELENGHADGRPSLVIAPKSVVPNWEAEAKRFAPHLRVLVLHGGSRSQYFDNIPDSDLVITSYALVQRDSAVLAASKFHVVALDEAQYIKNPATKAAQAVRELDARHRLALSGTPIENHLGELWSLMRFLMPGFLGSQDDFRRGFRTPIEKHKDPHRQRVLNRRVRPLVLRRTKDLVAGDLPPKTELTHAIDLTTAQADLYETVRVAMDGKVRDAIASQGVAKSQIIFLEALLKLRQICCHPALLKTDTAARVESAKLEFLMELLGTLLEEGRRILLFSQFTEMLGVISGRLKAAKIPHLKLTGETQDRGTLVQQFQQGDIPVFLISLKAGGTGLNLTAADTVIHYDPWWNPAAENQASDRAHRIGQTKPVFVHRLICRGTIEEKIQELQKHKAGLMDALFAEATTRFTLDRETLDALLAPLTDSGDDAL